MPLVRAESISKSRMDTATRIVRGVASGMEAVTRSPEELARARRSTRARVALGTLGGATVLGGTAGMATSLGGRLGPAKRVKIVGAQTPADKDHANRTVHSKGMTNRDQNSTVPVSVTRRGVPGRHKTGVVAARPANLGAGRNRMPSFASRDQNSSVGVSRIVARTPQGRYVSHENDLKVVRVERKRPTDSRVQHFTGVGKALPGGLGRSGTVPAARQALGRMQVGAGLRQIGRTPPVNGTRASLANGQRQSPRVAEAFRSRNTAFGSAPSRGQRLPQ